MYYFLLFPGSKHFSCFGNDLLFFILSLLSYLPVSLSLPLSSTFIHLPFIIIIIKISVRAEAEPVMCSQSFHFCAGIPVSLIVFLSPCFFFLSNIPLVFCTHPSIHFVFKLCRSLSRFHSPPIPPTLFPHYVTWRLYVHNS
jgi:hypothetical protein